MGGNGAVPAMPLAGGNSVWEGTTWLAANIPGWTPYRLSRTAYQSRYLSDTGRLFFNSFDALVPKDVNGTGDVYEYEPAGVGPAGAQCGPGSADGSEAFEPQREPAPSIIDPAGCVALISSGESSRESAFLDASETGGDVFFLTSGKLVPQDFDNALDVYDAHECTTQSPCLPEPASVPAPCNNEASCKPAPSPQPSVFGLLGSATFSGAGNVAPAPPPACKHRDFAILWASPEQSIGVGVDASVNSPSPRFRANPPIRWGAGRRSRQSHTTVTS